MTTSNNTQSPPQKDNKKRRGLLGTLIVAALGIAAVAAIFILGRGIWLLLRGGPEEVATPTPVAAAPTVIVVEAEPQPETQLIVVQPTLVSGGAVVSDQVAVVEPTAIPPTETPLPPTATPEPEPTLAEIVDEETTVVSISSEPVPIVFDPLDAIYEAGPPLYLGDTTYEWRLTSAFAPFAWHTVDLAWDRTEDGRVLIKSNPPFEGGAGRLVSRAIQADISVSPSLEVSVGELSPGTELGVEILAYETDKIVSYTAASITQVGQFVVDVRNITEWDGLQEFYISLTLRGTADAQAKIDQLTLRTVSSALDIARPATWEANFDTAPEWALENLETFAPETESTLGYRTVDPEVGFGKVSAGQFNANLSRHHLLVIDPELLAEGTQYTVQVQQETGEFLVVEPLSYQNNSERIGIDLRQYQDWDSGTPASLSIWINGNGDFALDNVSLRALPSLNPALVQVQPPITNFGWTSNTGLLNAQANAFQYTVAGENEFGTVVSDVLQLPKDEPVSLVFNTLEVTPDTWFDIQLFEEGGEERQYHLLRALQANQYCVGLENAINLLDGAPVRLAITTNAPSANLSVEAAQIQFGLTGCQ